MTLPATFSFNGAELPYFRHQYNGAWANEKCVEVAVVYERTRQSSPEATLEICNVLSHYYPVRHAVVDKFEAGAGVVNEDVVDFQPPRKYDLIVSISTFEHIGFDPYPDGAGQRREPLDHWKVMRALGLLRGWLATGGEAWVTFPLGYNPTLDDAWENRILGFDDEYCMRQTIPAFGTWEEGGHPVWEQVARQDAVIPRPYDGGTVVAFGVVKP